MLSQIIKTNTVRALKTSVSMPQRATLIAFKNERDCDCTCSRVPVVAKKQGEECGSTGCSCD